MYLSGLFSSKWQINSNSSTEKWEFIFSWNKNLRMILISSIAGSRISTKSIIFPSLCVLLVYFPYISFLYREPISPMVTKTSNKVFMTLWSSSPEGRDFLSPTKGFRLVLVGHITTLRLHVTCHKAKLGHMSLPCIARSEGHVINISPLLPHPNETEPDEEEIEGCLKSRKGRDIGEALPHFVNPS